MRKNNVKDEDIRNAVGSSRLQRRWFDVDDFNDSSRTEEDDDEDSDQTRRESADWSESF